MTRTALEKINALDRASFVALLGGLYEHSPWAAERAFAQAPFGNPAALVSALAAAVNQATGSERLALIRAHPELAGEKLRAKTLTDSSMSEQTSIGLDRLSSDEIAEWTRFNAAYRERFGFPFIICVRLHTKPQILAAMQARISNDEATEIRAAIAQIHDIAHLRLTDLLARLDAEA